MVLCILSFQNAEALGSGPVWCRRLPCTLFQEAQLLPSCLALPCPSGATSLAAPQALQPLRVGKGALAASPLELWYRVLSGAAPPSLSPQDEQIERERASQHLPGGCCALAAIYLMGKFYVANAGDSRYSPAGQPSALLRDWGHLRRVGWCRRDAGEEHPAPSCLGEGGGGRTGQSSPACSMSWGQCALL